MASIAHIPAETDLLCEGCGYVLNGLPTAGVCPECGKPIHESAASLRKPPPWETRAANPVGAFITTSAGVWFSPRKLFRSMTLRPATGSRRSLSFAIVHWLLASLLFTSAGWFHFLWLEGLYTVPGSVRMLAPLLLWGLFILALVVFTRLTARLTTLEASYRGIRLPQKTVTRALHYHSATLLPVALIAFATVVGYQFFTARNIIPATTGVIYLFVLAGEVIASAFYLFTAYWAAMRNLMYGNG